MISSRPQHPHWNVNSKINRPPPTEKMYVNLLLQIVWYYLESYISWFNRLSQLTGSSICFLKKKKHRVKVIEFWIEVNIGIYFSRMWGGVEEVKIIDSYFWKKIEKKCVYFFLKLNLNFLLKSDHYYIFFY